MWRQPLKHFTWFILECFVPNIQSDTKWTLNKIFRDWSHLLEKMKSRTDFNPFLYPLKTPENLWCYEVPKCFREEVWRIWKFKMWKGAGIFSKRWHIIFWMKSSEHYSWSFKTSFIKLCSFPMLNTFLSMDGENLWSTMQNITKRSYAKYRPLRHAHRLIDKFSLVFQLVK